MKKIFVLTVLCLTAFFAKANDYRGNDDHYKYEQERIVEKSFNVDALSSLEMDGKFSDFIITAWDEQQIDFKIKITVKSDNQKKLESKFNSIGIYLAQEDNHIKAETVFGDYDYKSFDGSITIKYYVKVPRDVSMDLETKYGDITIDEVREKLEAEVKYGDFKADNILIDDITKSSIEVKYGNINIDNVGKIELDLEYGDAKINTCGYIDGTLKYSKIFITEMNDGVIENKYSTTRIEKTNKVRFTDAAYSDLKVSNCTNTLSVKMRYSDLSAAVTSNSPIVDVDGQYSDAVLYLNGTASFNYDLESSYGDITFKGFFDTSSIAGNGHYGNGEPGRLDISIRYGDVDICKNK